MKEILEQHKSKIFPRDHNNEILVSSSVQFASKKRNRQSQSMGGKFTVFQESRDDE